VRPAIAAIEPSGIADRDTLSLYGTRTGCRTTRPLRGLLCQPGICRAHRHRGCRSRATSLTRRRRPA